MQFTDAFTGFVDFAANLTGDRETAEELVRNTFRFNKELQAGDLVLPGVTDMISGLSKDLSQMRYFDRLPAFAPQSVKGVSPADLENIGEIITAGDTARKSSLGRFAAQVGKPRELSLITPTKVWFGTRTAPRRQQIQLGEQANELLHYGEATVEAVQNDLRAFAAEQFGVDPATVDIDELEMEFVAEKVDPGDTRKRDRIFKGADLVRNILAARTDMSTALTQYSLAVQAAANSGNPALAQAVLTPVMREMLQRRGRLPGGAAPDAGSTVVPPPTPAPAPRTDEDLIIQSIIEANKADDATLTQVMEEINALREALGTPAPPEVPEAP
jgi:hypothetical protein